MVMEAQNHCITRALSTTNRGRRAAAIVRSRWSAPAASAAKPNEASSHTKCARAGLGASEVLRGGACRAAGCLAPQVLDHRGLDVKARDLAKRCGW